MNERGQLIVVSAPSGAGKTSLCKSLMERLARDGHKPLVWSCSYTTRKKRAGEVHGEDYFFVDDETFDAMVERGEFAEWANVHGRRYGTSKKYLEDAKSGGTDLLVEVDTQGAAQLRAQAVEGCFIFVLPPSWDELESRLRGRGTEADVEVEKRLERAREEVLEWERFDYIIVNDDFEGAVEKLEAIALARRQEKRYMRSRAKAILADARSG